MNKSNSKPLILYNIVLGSILSLLFLGIDLVISENGSMADGMFMFPFSQEEVQVQVSEAVYEDKIGYSQPSTSNHFVIINARVTNIGNVTHHANSLFFTLIDSNGRSYSIDYATFDMAVLGKEFPTVDLQQKTNAEGILIFQTPKDVKPKSIVYSPMLGEEVNVDVVQK